MVETLHSNAGAVGSMPNQAAKAPHASWPKSQNMKQKQYYNKLNKDFKKTVHTKNNNNNLKKKEHWSPPQVLSSVFCLEWGLGLLFTDEPVPGTLLLLFNHSVVSDSLQPHGLQHTRLPCP